MLKLVKTTNDSVVVQNLCKTSLDVALNPEFSLEYDYFTITRGDNHVFTVIKKDGSTWDFDWGARGSTLISEGTRRLKEKVLNFLYSQHVFVGLRGEPARVQLWPINERRMIKIIDANGNYDCFEFRCNDEEAKAKARQLIGQPLRFAASYNPMTHNKTYFASCKR